jgi:hypothetical protein
MIKWWYNYQSNKVTMFTAVRKIYFAEMALSLNRDKGVDEALENIKNAMADLSSVYQSLRERKKNLEEENKGTN